MSSTEAAVEPPLFLSGDPAAGRQLRRLTERLVDAVTGWAAADAGPRTAIEPKALADLVATLDPCPEDGVSADQVLAEVADRVLAHGVRTFDPRCAAHLHSPTLLTAAAAELAIGATNQSMDSYDQAPAATLVEDHLVRWLAGVVGLPDGASGVLTAGGTASNLLGLLLARDHAALTAPGAGVAAPAAGPHHVVGPAQLAVPGAVALDEPGGVAEQGLPARAEAAGWRIVASEAAHFSVQRAAAVLGLGHRAVVGVAADGHGRIDLTALDATLARLDDQGLRVVALVGTAGTTDLGAVDPLAALAERARAHGAWFHVDAAVGAALCLSDRLRPLVAGLAQADSLTADLHKLWWQPIGASALLVRDPALLAPLRHPSDYLDRPDDDATGVLNLVGRSLDTSRRFDALKVLVSLRSTGRRRLAAMVEHVVGTTAATARAVDRHPDLELLAPPSTVTVVFRWRPCDRDLDAAGLDEVNTAVQRALFASGRAVVGRTRHHGRVALKLTVVNPQATADDLAALLDLIAAEARALVEPRRLAGDDRGSGSAQIAATAAAGESLLNCFLRETSGWRFVADDLVIPLSRRGADVVVGVRHRSPTFRHRFAWPARLVVGGQASPLGYPALAGLLIDELGDDRPAAPTDLLARMLDSLHATIGYLEQRSDEIDRLWSAEPLDFITSEQALLLGHPLHPTPKSRGEMSPRDRTRYSPETQGQFRLHWLAARPDVVRHASATGTPAPDEIEAMLRSDPATDKTALARLGRESRRRILLPAHPWELAHLRQQPDLAALFDDEALVDLGPLGSPVTPTTSVRTVYQPGWPWQLKFSLHVRITNSMRVTLPKELDRAVEAARLARTVVGEQAARVAPAFRCVHDPAHLTVAHDGRVVDGLSVLLRQNRWPRDAGSTNVTAVTTLCQDHPFGGPSRLGAIVRRRAEHEGRPPTELGREWFARFCEVAVVSLVRLYLDVGLCFEPHQQNTLLELDPMGLPERCVYRDSQGYFHREAAHADMVAVIPGLGEATESIFPEALADERLVYYPFLNLTLGVVNALGAAGCADEEVLLADLRRCLEAQRSRGGRYPATLLDRLLDDEKWPCKGNLRTRYHDLDELVGDIETQSVYVTVPNPLRGSAS